MLGWEFPPFISGGLGTACYGLTRAMDSLGLKVSFVLPKVVSGEYTSHVRLLTPGSRPKNMTSYAVKELKNVTFHSITSTLQPYTLPEQYEHKGEQSDFVREHFGHSQVFSDAACSGVHYGQDMYSEVHRYAAVAVSLALYESFDLIHAHDWMTYPAGMAAAAATGKPLIVHVHSTEFDRSGDHVHQRIYDIERQGVQNADHVITVSNRMCDTLVERYAVPATKIDVVYNGVDRHSYVDAIEETFSITRREQIVLFLGRITMQKGPEYFLQAAKEVLSHMEHVRFIMAGSGDQMNQCVEMAAALGIGHRVLFTGFLRGDDVSRIYQMADLYVMPSVSEPFGIAPLEAMDHNVPVLISKQSGVAEVLSHVLKVNFWDTQEMANKIIAVLKHAPLRKTLQEYGINEIGSLTWSNAACQCLKVYEKLKT